MKNKTKKKLLAGTLSAAVAVTTVPYAVMAASYQDTAGHWAETAIDRWSDRGLIQGYDGLFQPDDAVTRAEMAVLIDRLMKYQTTGDAQFLDLPETWYTDAVQKAAAGQVLLGYEGYVRPEDSVTREEAAVMMARALHLQPNTNGTLGYTDREQISDWAVGYVSVMEEKGYMHGLEDGSFAPQQAMTRAYAVQMIDNIIKGYYDKPGTYTDTVDGLILVNSSGVILKDMKIQDIILAPGLGDAKVTLQNSTISGSQTILGGNLATGGGSTGGGNSNIGGGGGGSTGGGSSVIIASKTNMIVNSDYAGKSGTITVDRRRYTYGENAFGTLQEALAQANTLGQKVTITLTGDLVTDETIEVTVPQLTLNGGGHTITVNKTDTAKKDGLQLVGNESIDIVNLDVVLGGTANQWSGSYGIQAYQSKLNIGKVKISGGDAGLLVNGSEVTLTGQLDVSNNTFGGIEVSMGAEATTNPILTGEQGYLVNTTEQNGLPTIWVDNADQITATIGISGLFSEEVDKNGKKQKHFYLNEENLTPDDTVAKVETPEQILDAVSDPDIKTIQLTQDVTLDAPIELTRAVSFNGQGNTLTVPSNAKSGLVLVMPQGTARTSEPIEISNLKIVFEGEAPTDWRSAYGLQIYRASNVTLRDIQVSNGNAGILVNGSEVKLAGAIDVSGNTFGGIEVSKGVDVTEEPVLSGAPESLTNTTEAVGKPTIWTDGVGAETVQIGGLFSETVDKGEKQQTHFYLRQENLSQPITSVAEVGTAEELVNAVNNPSVQTVRLSNNIETQTPIEVGRVLTIDGQNHTLSAPVSARNVLVLTTSAESRDTGRAIEVQNLHVTFTDGAPAEWKSAYGIQAYQALHVILRDVQASGGNAGILVNGSEVTLEGVVDVSNNTFGGIEVGKGAGVSKEPVLMGAVSNLQNTTEAAGKPTIWTDGVGEDTVQIDGLHKAYVQEKNQNHYFLSDTNLPPASI